MAKPFKVWEGREQAISIENVLRSFIDPTLQILSCNYIINDLNGSYQAAGERFRLNWRGESEVVAIVEWNHAVDGEKRDILGLEDI
jgi:hypothetical protein